MHTYIHSIELLIESLPPVSSDEHRLLKQLLDIYNEEKLYGRPIHNATETITVKVGVALLQILDLEEINEVLTTKVWMRFVSCCFLFYIA